MADAAARPHGYAGIALLNEEPKHGRPMPRSRGDARQVPDKSRRRHPCV